MENPLKALKLDYWYKALLVIGVVVLLQHHTHEITIRRGLF